MTSTTAAVLESIDAGGSHVALESVDIQASLRGLFTDVVVTQVYKNLESVNIEAVYTFPLPLDAVLLDLSLELNGKILRGVVQASVKAEESYEDAIDDGDSAILLQQLEPGVFTLNAGNILLGEQAVVRFRYGQLHRWQGDSLRFHLPVTIAPRYGDLSASGLAPHQAPEYALSADHGFTLGVRIDGALAQADFDCPSHSVAVSTSNDVRELSLSGGSALMDRDFVLVLKEPVGSAVEGFWAPDGAEHVALASFHPVFPEDVPASPRCVKLVVDCSGSMAGDSIAQAKAALREIISLLKPGDFFNLVTFGSGFNLLFPEPVIASEDNTRTAARFVEQIDADMGGTEIGTALNAAYRCGRMEGLPADVLLITDGEVWGHQQVVKDARSSGHRIFTVGVGSAVSEALLRRIAETTSGACELVSPRETMSEHIVRHFRRIDQPKAQSVRIEWPIEPIRQSPRELETVYAGDTLHVFGWLSEHPAGNIGLVMTFEDGRSVTQEVNLSPDLMADDELLLGLPRVAAHARIASLDSEEALILAEHYQLVTEQTSCILVFEREAEQKPGKIPALRKAPQMLAAGWGGMGSVHHSMEFDSPMSDADTGVMLSVPRDDVCFSMALPETDAKPKSRKALREADEQVYEPASTKKSTLHNDSRDYTDTASFSRFQDTSDVGHLISSLNARYPEIMNAQLDIVALAGLVELGLDQEIADELSVLSGAGKSEQDIIVAFLAALSESNYGERFSRHVKRLIRAAEKRTPLDLSVKEAVQNIVEHV